MPSARTKTAILKSFRDLTDKKSGAREYKVDLHFHTPASSDAREKRKYDHNPYSIKFPKLKAKATSAERAAHAKKIAEMKQSWEAKSQKKAAEIVDKLLAEDIAVVAITDHNSQGFTRNSEENPRVHDVESSTWYELIAEEVDRRASDDSAPPLLVLPGVELSCSGVHILAVFPPERPRRLAAFRIGYLLDQMDFAVEQWGSNSAVSKRSQVDAIRLIAELGGLPILAHIDGSDQATLKLYKPGKGALRNIFAEPTLLGAEIVDPGAMKKTVHGKKYTFKSWIDGVREDNQLPPLAFFQGSDAHSVKNKNLGKRFTWVKMTEPSFEGLRAALLDAYSRVRISDEPTPSSDGAFLYGMTVSGGFAKDTKLRFNRHLNCVLGRHGAGKTTLAGLIRKSNADKPGLPSGSVNLYMEHVENGESTYYCFRHRQGGQPRLTTFRFGEDGSDFEQLTRQQVAELPFEPKIFRPERIERIIANRERLTEFLEEHFGDDHGGLVRSFNRLNQPQAVFNNDERQLLRLAREQGELKLFIKVDNKREVEFFQLDKGMKITAILLVLLLDDRFGPIVIDAPEDHVDNEGIFRFITPRIRDIKHWRQLVVFSGNPNVAVPSDPENIVILESTDERIKKVDAGNAIDTPQVKERVSRLLEGGMAAFASRRLKYE